MLKVNSIRYPGVGRPIMISKNLGFIHLKGKTPHEVGCQFGQAFSKDLVNFNKSLKNMFAEKVGRFLSALAYYIALPFYSLIQWCRITKPIRKEIMGIARGAEDLHRFNVIRKMKMIRLSSLYEFQINFGQGCTSFAKKHEDWNFLNLLYKLIGRNLDMIFDASGTLDRSWIILYEIEGQRPFISIGPIFFNLAPTTAILEGENGDPIFFAIHNLMGPRNLWGKPTVTLMRQIANQPSLEDILRLLSKSKETCSKKLIINDVVADFIANEVYFRKMKPDEDYIVATNHPQTPEAKEHVSEEEILHGWLINPTARYYATKEYLKGKPTSIEVAVEALSNQYDPTRKKDRVRGHIVQPPFCNSEEYISQTYTSVIADFKDEMFWVGAGPWAASGNFYGFNINNLWEWARSEGLKDLAYKIYEQKLDEEKIQEFESGRAQVKVLRQGFEAYRKGKFYDAWVHLTNVLKDDQDDVEARVCLGAINLEEHFRNGSSFTYLILAREYFESVINIEKTSKIETRFLRGSPFAYLLLGMSYDLQGKREGDRKIAEKYYKKIIEFKMELEKANEFNEFVVEAAEWAEQFLKKPCKKLPRHKKMVKLVL